MRKIFLFFAAILCAMSVQGANTMRIYCKNSQSWWKADGAAVGAYYWGTGGNANSWPGTRMNQVSGQTDLWYIDVDTDKYQNIIFTRVNGSGSVSDWGAKTGDLTIANTKNQYTISSSSAVWGNPGVTGSWGTYKPTSTAALATSAENIFVGGQATLTPSLTSNASANTIKETAYAISPEGANVSGNTFTATAAGTYTVTATVTYYPLGCPTLTSTATATTTITAEVPAEETHDVTVSYMFGETIVAEPTIVNTVGVETSVKVTAPEIAKYTFANWTLGADVATTDALTSNEINITTQAGGSDFTLVANYEKAKLTYTVTVPAGTENCYLVGAMNGWDVANPIEMTKQGENVFTVTLEDVEKTDEYKYISQKGTWDYADVQEANRTWNANDVVTAWKDPLATGLYLRGTMNEWGTIDQFKKEAADAATAIVVVALKADTTYEFKVASADWSEGYSSTTAFTATSTQTLSTDVQDNAKLTTVAAGDYTFTWDLNTKKLTVTYPELPKYTVTATAENGTIEGIENEGVYTQGDEVTLNAKAAKGYHFVKWDDESTDNPRTITVTEDVTLQAIFEINNYTITASTTREKLTQTIAIDGDNADWANIPMLSEPGVGPMVKMVVPQEGTTLPEGAAFALMVQGDHEQILAGYPVIYTDADKSIATGGTSSSYPNMGKDYEMATWTDGSLYGTNSTNTIREMSIAKDAFSSVPFDGSVYAWLTFAWGELYLPATPSNNGWKWSESVYHPYDVKPYTFNDLASTHTAVGAFNTHEALTPGESLQLSKGGHDTALWVSWAVELTQPAIYNISANIVATNSTSLDLYLVDIKTNTIVATREGAKKEAPQAEFEYGEWDLTNVPAGKYMLKAKNHVQYSNMVFHSVTLAPQESDVEIESAEHILKGDGTYKYGEVATLTATPAIGYSFVNWSDGATANPYSFIVTKDVEIAANFEKLTYTVTATATNGTVTGAGTYEHGEEVTLTATPAFDYQFVKWSNESTENPLTITVTDNVTLEAIFAEVAATEKKESGVFSISAHKTATFATGNLQYNVGTQTWRFAKQQYQVVGEQNINLGDPAFTGWIDMLGWSNGEANNYGVNPSNKNEYYAGEFVDWGTKMGEGWSTLSAEEWSYLLNTRENAASLKQTAKVDTIIGLLLFPDGWVMPEDVVVEAEMDEYFEVNIYNYTLEQWTKLEQAGAIFLPAAGRRAGGYGNMINYDQVEETDENKLNGGYYRHQDNTNIYCYYWTSTIDEDKNVSYLHNVLALGNNEYTIGNGAIWGEKGRYGQSVRLAKVAYDKHTVTATAENGTVTGAGEYTHGTEITLTATANEHYVFVNWTKGEEVVAETAEYTFTVEADVELVANFKLDSHTVAATAENGTVEGAGTYEHGTEVTLTATANEGYEFVKWSNELTENPLTITVTEDVTISAIFQEVIPVITYTVKWYTAVGETTEVTLEEGADITKPETNPEMEGYVFIGWTDECFVAEDGSDFTAIEDFGTADADKEYYAVFAVETTTDGGGIAIVTDLLNRATTGATNQNYGAWSDKTATSSAVYAGQSAGSNESIQLRSKNSNSGIVTTTSGGKAKKVTIDWNTNTSNGRTVSIYGKNSAYTQATDLYDTTNQGTELGTIVCGTSTELTISGEYAYIGIRSKDGAMYLNSVSIDWETTVSGEPTTTYSNYMTTCTPDEYTIEWSVNGKVAYTTTVVEGEALVLPPEEPEVCSGKVFMGWATTATVNADGSAITWVDETVIPESDKNYYAVFATKTVDETNETYTKTATVNIADYASANKWVDATKYENVIIDQNITATAATATGTGNTGKYYDSGNNWRFYQTDEDATLTINAAEGVTINNVTVTYVDNSTSGVLTFNSSNIASGNTVEVNASSITFNVGNTSTATNGQVRVTNISVDYTFSGTITSTTYADYSTICVIPEYTVTFDYSVDAGYITVNDVRISEKEVTYEEGTVLTVKALTFNDYSFNAWEDEDENELSTEPTYTFTVTKDVVLKAIITYEQGAVGTSVENNNVVSSKTMKVIQNGRLMIIREGKTYNAQGQMIE